MKLEHLVLNLNEFPGVDLGKIISSRIGSSLKSLYLSCNGDGYDWEFNNALESLKPDGLELIL
jgi:hypothetical protein